LRDQLYAKHYLGQKDAITIREAVELLHSEKSRQCSTRNTTATCNSLKAQLGRVIGLGQDLMILDVASLSKLVGLRRRDGVTEGTVRQLMVAVSSLLATADRLGYAAPQIKVPVIQVHNTRLTTLDVQQEARVLEIIEERGEAGHDDRDLFLLLLDTAARLNEIQQMTWSQLDLDSGVINLWRSKNGTGGMIKLTSRCMKVLKCRKQKQRHESLVFPSATGGLRRTTPKTLSNAYEAAGLEGFTTHCLRHTACTRLLTAGMPIASVSKLMGHSSISITSSRYSHLAESHVAAQAAHILENYS